jgi:hypothetical protein
MKKDFPGRQRGKCFVHRGLVRQKHEVCIVQVETGYTYGVLVPGHKGLCKSL